MLDREMFLLRAQLSAGELEWFVAAGWLGAHPPGQDFTEADLGRVLLIRSLRQDCGVNDEGVEVALRLLDQLHGARRALAGLAGVIRTLPPPLREELVRALRAGEADNTPP
ncbi:MAG: hypothetical protein IT556_15020 [Acetobacteraceae bacterium]|nr:hypothetical protein [Acetobacteraceae bacterium]